MNFVIYLKNVMIVIVIVHVIAIVNKIIENVYVLLINILNFVKKILKKYYLKKNYKSYFNVGYIKYLYLLQKAADQIISKN